MRISCVFCKVLVVLSGAILTAFGQTTLHQLTFGGSGTDSIRGITTDASGNIYVVGTTYSADLPTLNAFQAANKGTQVLYSADAGLTWSALQSPLSPRPGASPNPQIAVDPTNAAIVYAAGGTTLCRSQNSGKSFQCANLSFLSSGDSITQLLVDPHTTTRLYLLTRAAGPFVSADAGQTWHPANQGLANASFPYMLTADPFHSGVLFAWNGNSGFVSRDAGATWVRASLSYPSGVSSGETLFGFFFDATTPGVVYGPGFTGSPASGAAITIQKSTDGGQTWTQLNLPFSIYTFIGPDPQAAATLYAIGTSCGSTSLWKSSDGGTTWTSTPVPAGLIGPVAFDPRNPQIILAGHYSPNPGANPAMYRSADGGKTWSSVAQQILQPAFAPSAAGIVYAIGNATSDAFVAKFLPDGQTLLFATYFGGAGNDIGNIISLDGAGNIWIAGNTSSTDLAITPGAFQSTLKGQTNGFVAKFTNDGQLVASTYFGGSVNDTISSLAAGPNGNVWFGGRWSSPDFPFLSSTPNPAIPLSTAGGFVAELDPSAQSVLFATTLDGSLNGSALAVDASGDVIVTGSTTDPHFQTTVQPLPTVAPATSALARVFVLKLDSAGSIIYSTTFGGSQPAPVTGRSVGFPSGGGLDNSGVAAAVDTAGNAYVTGYTSATDFPTTPGAFQTALADACPYPAFEVNTGFIGVISAFYMDDSFVVKLSPNGKTALYSTLIGGQCYDHPTGLSVDASGRAVIAGETDSFDYPQAFPIAGAPARSLYSSFLSILNPAGSSLDFSTYLNAGSTPTVAAASTGTYDVAGSVGPSAQTSTFSGAYLPPASGALTHGDVSVLSLAQIAPALDLTQVLNAFSLQAGPITPGEIVALSVPGLAPDQPVDVGIYPHAPLTTTLAGVSVLFDGRPAYLTTVLPGKIVCIVPQEIAGQTTTAVQVTTGSAFSNVVSVNVSAAAPGLLSLDGSGTGLANARNADGTLNGPSNPAAIGSLVTIYFTGAGVTNPPEADGALPGSGVVPVAGLPIYPAGGTAYALPGFVPGIFAYAFIVPANGGSVLQVSTQTNAYNSQFLQIYVH